VVNNLYWNRYACVAVIHEDWSKTYIWGGFDDKYFEDIVKYLNK
jgi:hypothetical protein